MSIGLVVQRPRKTEATSLLTLDEWKRVISSSQDLRLRGEPYLAVEPKTGIGIEIPVGVADSEILIDGEWLPFLRFSRVGY